MPLLPALLTLLILHAGHAGAAEPGAFERHAQEGIRAILLQSPVADRGTASSPAASLAPVPGQRPGQEHFFPDAPSAMGARVQESIPATPETARRTRGLSLEERRALRRQIDEVGHDIYSPRR